MQLHPEASSSLDEIRHITVPDIGDHKDIPVIEILVKPGDRVEKDAPLLILESEKATLDIPSPESGTVTTMAVSVGDRVSVGSMLLTLNVSNGSIVLSNAEAVIDSNPLSSITDVDRKAYASPSVRRYARALGISLNAVRGSGPKGRILKNDVERLEPPMSHHDSAGTSADNPGTPAAAALPRMDFSRFGATDRVSLTRIKKIAGANLARNWARIPHVSNFDEADITDLEVFRLRLTAQDPKPAVKVTVLAFLMKAAAAALQRYPEFNSSLEGEELIMKHYYHIAFAADTREGLVVPVIRDVNTKGILQIATEAAQLAEQARAGRLQLTDMQGASFTISSLGSIGGNGFTPIINAPEVAILGVARAKMQPVWDGSSFQPRRMLPLTLSWDHRVVDGIAAARFLTYLSSVLSDCRQLLL